MSVLALPAELHAGDGELSETELGRVVGELRWYWVIDTCAYLLWAFRICCDGGRWTYLSVRKHRAYVSFLGRGLWLDCIVATETIRCSA